MKKPIRILGVRGVRIDQFTQLATRMSGTARSGPVIRRPENHGAIGSGVKIGVGKARFQLGWSYLSHASAGGGKHTVRGGQLQFPKIQIEVAARREAGVERPSRRAGEAERHREN